MTKTLFKWLVLFTLIPSFTNASFTKIEGLYEDARGWYQWKEFKLGSDISYWALQMIQPKIAQAGELTELEQIKMWIITIAQEYGVDSDDMLNLANCESRFNPKARGDYRSEIDTFMARGLYQWWASSWKKYNAIYKTELNREEWKDQTIMTGKVLADGGEDNWRNCWRYIHKK